MDKKYSLEDLEKLINSIPYEVSLQNEKGEYLFVNDSLLETLEVDRDDIIGKKPSEVLAPGDASLMEQVDKKIINNKKGIFTEIKSDRDGKWYDLYKKVIDNNYIVCVVNEVNVNIFRAYDNFYYSDNPDFLGYNDMVCDIYNREFTYEQFRKRFTVLCENIQYKVKADGTSVYLINEKTNKLEQFAKTGQNTDICDELKERLCNEKNKMIEIIKNDPTYKCPNPCSYFKTNKDKWLVKYFPIRYASRFIGVLSIYYIDEDSIKFEADDFIKSVCYKLGILCENSKVRHRLEVVSRENEETKDELKVFLETSSDVWAIMEKDGTLLKVSKSTQDIFGWSEEEIFKYKYQDLIHPDDRKSTREYVHNRRITGQEKGFDLINRYRCKNGEYKLIQWSWTSQNDNLIVVLTGKDITFQRKLEEENTRIHNELVMETLKTQFFINMSHEFRTPINIILSSVQLMDIYINNNENEKMSRNLKYIKQNSYRLLKLINNIIDINKIESGVCGINLHNCNIIDIIEKIVLSVVQYAESFNCSITFDTDIEEIITACDVDKIEKIMLNLLSNALKYVDNNGKIIVKIETDLDNKILYVSVWDSGIEIEKEDSQKIFDRFTRIDNSLARECEGSGIGLELTKSLVELHGGTIWANTDVEKGAEIKFTLPIRTIDENDNKHVKEFESKIEKCNVEFSDIYSLV